MEQKPAEYARQHILIADSDTGNVKLLIKALEERGYAARSAPARATFIDEVRSNPPDLILLDTDMSEMSGCEVCEQLKADSELGDIPVILVAPINGAVDKARLFRAGGADYITKPIEFSEVEARVQTHLELSRQRRELEQGQARLSEAERLRDNLVHMLAHDLRNSLTAISGYLELIGLTGRETLTEKGLQYVQKGTESVSNLVETLNTMLDVNKMESGAIKLHLTKFDLAALIRKLLSDIQPRGGRIELASPEPGTRVDVTGDQDLLRRVTRNLVANTLKSAGKESPVRVGIEDRPDCVRVSVRNSGPGISPDRLSKIFDKSGQAEGAQGSKTYSQGLAFTFCRLALEAHGGRIGAESSPDNGSTFWFELTKNP